MKKGSSKTTGSSARMSAARATSAQSFGPEKAKIGSCMSDLGDLPATHEAGRTDGEDDQDEKERDAFLEVRVDHPEQLLEEPDHQAADEPPSAPRHGDGTHRKPAPGRAARGAGQPAPKTPGRARGGGRTVPGGRRPRSRSGGRPRRMGREI